MSDLYWKRRYDSLKGRYLRQILSKYEYKLYQYVIVMGSVTSNDVAKKFNTSIPNAGTRLNRMCHKLVLYRVNVGDVTGGREYNYMIAEL